jgi:hypothetical protein
MKAGLPYIADVTLKHFSAVPWQLRRFKSLMRLGYAIYRLKKE